MIRKSLVAASVFFLVFRAQEADSFIILDEKPKTFVVFQHYSWRLQDAMAKCLEMLGRKGDVILSPNNLTFCAINDDLTPRPDLVKLELPSDRPCIVIAYAGAGHMVKGAADTATINLGVRKLQKLVEILHEKGAEAVFVSTNHFHWNRYTVTAGSHTDIDDTLIVNKYNEITRRDWQGVNIGTLTKSVFPHGVLHDFEHLTDCGRAAYGLQWASAIYRHDGLVPPQSLRSGFESALQARAKSTSGNKISLVKTSTPGSFRIGDSIVADISFDSSFAAKSRTIGIRLACFTGGRAGLFMLVDSIPLSRYLRLKTVIPDSAVLCAFQPNRTANSRYRVEGDSACIQILDSPASGSGLYFLSQTLPLLDRNGNVRVAAPISMRLRIYKDNGKHSDAAIYSLTGRNMNKGSTNAVIRHDAAKKIVFAGMRFR